MKKPLLTLTILTASSLVFLEVAAADREKIASLVAQIQRADYEGDRATLQRCYYDLEPYVESDVAARVRYWRGFALWRRSINGFNDSVDPAELEKDLEQAFSEFSEATRKDPAFVDATVGMISCLGYRAFMHRQDQPRVRELVGQMYPLISQAKESAPDNPRLLWVLGPVLWYTPPERGGGPDKVEENYEKALELCSKTGPSSDPLEPSWGKPELMMSLAHTNLTKNTPDLAAAERLARGALEIVPHWRYLRDILLPQILDAKTKAN